MLTTKRTKSAHCLTAIYLESMTPTEVRGNKGGRDRAIPRCHLQVIFFTPADQEPTTECIATASNVNWTLNQCGNKPARPIRSPIHEHSIGPQLQADNSRPPVCQRSCHCFCSFPAF